MRTLAYGIFLLMVILTPTQAKWATVADAPIKNLYSQEIYVNNDGTYEKIAEATRELLTETGRDQSNFTLYYNDDSEKIEILDAKTIFQGKEYKLDKGLVEDKPLASSYKGFDQYRQILLAFPKVEVGAKLYLKYKFIQKKALLDNFFAERFYFGSGEYVASSFIKIKSKIPLHILVNDPERVLKVTENKTKEFYNLEMRLTKQIYNDVRNEPSPLVIDDKYFTWVSVSSLNKWKDFAAYQGKLYAKVFTQKLPEDFERILIAAKQKNSEVEQINAVTSLLNDKIRYMGDWRSINGRFVPRDLDKISKTQLGDCKDFAAATAAILTKMGYKAQIVLVMRGITNLSPQILPGFEVFNHAIVKVTNKQGKVYWIDPTNFESMADGIFPDIAGKMALIVDSKEPSYEKIPNVDPMHAEDDIKRQWEILDNNKIIESGSMLIKNEAALGFVGSALRISNEAIKNSIFYLLAGLDLDEKNKKSMNLPPLNSRIVKDVALNYSFERENDILQTNVGPALRLRYSGPISILYDISQDYISGALIANYPSTTKRQMTIKNINAKNIKALNKEMKTPWLYIKRDCGFNNKHELQIEDTLTIYKNLIPREDFKNPEFIKLKKWLKDNFKDVIIVFEPKKK